MAEIKIEKKKRLWPWLLFSLLAVSLLFFFFYGRDNIDPDFATDDQYITNENDLLAVKENNATVEDFINFVDNNKNEMSLDHVFTNDALLKLTNATGAMANEVGYDVKTDLEKVEGYAQLIIKDSFDTTHADNIRKASDVLTMVIKNIQKAKYPSLEAEVNDLQMASESIKPGILTLDQKDAVKNYFAKTAAILQKMN